MTYPENRTDQVADTSIGELLGNISGDLSQLFRQEVELAKAELKQEAAKAGKAAGFLGAAGFAGYLAVVLLSFALVFGLANVMDAGWAALIVAVLWGDRRRDPVRLRPQQAQVRRPGAAPHRRHSQGGRAMAQEPDQLRQDIEATRARMTRDVDLLAEKTSPTKVAQRRWTSVKEKVMGSTDHATSAVASTVQDKAGTVQDKASHLSDVAGEKAHDAADAVRSAPQALATQTKGNPVAAGIIAFGIGMLAATLIPVTDAEKRAGQQLKDNSGELTDKVKDVAAEMKDDLSGTVQHAVGEVKATAADAAQTTKDQAQSSAQDVKDQARHAAS